MIKASASFAHLYILWIKSGLTANKMCADVYSDWAVAADVNNKLLLNCLDIPNEQAVIRVT